MKAKLYQKDKVKILELLHSLLENTSHQLSFLSFHICYAYPKVSLQTSTKAP